MTSCGVLFTLSTFPSNEGPLSLKNHSYDSLADTTNNICFISTLTQFLIVNPRFPSMAVFY